MVIMPFLVPEDAKIEPEHIKGCYSGHKVFDGEKNPAVVPGGNKDLVLAEESGKRGMPAMARQAAKNVMWVMGRYLRNPPISYIKLLCMAWITEPAPRNSNALNMAWVNRWNIEAM